MTHMNGAAGVGGDGRHLAGLPTLADMGVLAELGTLPNTLPPEDGFLGTDWRLAGADDSVPSSSS